MMKTLLRYRKLRNVVRNRAPTPTKTENAANRAARKEMAAPSSQSMLPLTMLGENAAERAARKEREELRFNGTSEFQEGKEPQELQVDGTSKFQEGGSKKSSVLMEPVSSKLYADEGAEEESNAKICNSSGEERQCYTVSMMAEKRNTCDFSGP